MRKSCNKCIWNDQCGSRHICSHYTPAVEEDNTENLIEKNRQEFFEYWYRCVLGNKDYFSD